MSHDLVRIRYGIVVRQLLDVAMIALDHSLICAFVKAQIICTVCYVQH